MNDEPDDRLTFATNEELIDELARRSSCLVVAGLMKSDEIPEGEGMSFYYRGGIFTALGMLGEASEQLRATMRSPPDDE